MNPTSGLTARKAALRILASALARRDGLESALAEPALLRLDVRDRAFARAAAMATLRRLGPIDAALARHMSRAPPAAVTDILRLGAAQAFYLATPDFAAAATSVDLAPRPFKPLVNAVMRRLTGEGAPRDDAAVLAPAWLLARWRQAFGGAAALSIAAMIAEEPATDLSFAAEPDAGLIAALEVEMLAGGSGRTARRGDPAAWPGFSEGFWWVQDCAAAIPARLLDVRPGETALDLCAAPGGKTQQLAAAGAAVTAVERSGQRLARLRENLTRTRLSAETIACEVSAWEDARRFDAVLLDAPCSATGAFRRHPDVLWNTRPRDIAALAVRQGRLLTAAAARVRPGGRLVYSVCSLEREEGEAQIAEFLRAQPDFSLDPVTAGEGGAPAASVTPEGWLRILPHHLSGGLDGFFVARLRRGSGTADGLT